MNDILTQPCESELPGANILLMGDSGTGKTTALKTLIKCGITPFVIMTEPAQEVLGDVPADKLHWHYVKPMADSVDELLNMANMVNRSNFDSISKYTDPKKMMHTQWMEVLKQLQNFTCDRTGEEFGNVMQWNTDRALVLDSMSGLNEMVKSLVVGGKPMLQMQDWQIAQNTMKRLLDTLTTSTHCWLIVTAHEEREQDEITGGTKVMVSSLGKKLAPVIPRFFSDVIETERKGDKFSWTTASSLATVKARNLPIAANLPPSFEPLVQSWKSRGGKICPTVAEAKETEAT